MKITGDREFEFSGMGGATATSFFYTGAMSRTGSATITGYYDIIPARTADSRAKVTKVVSSTYPLPPSKDSYYLTATGFFGGVTYETPHGISYKDVEGAGKTGEYNFYMAFHGPGYYQPRHGELLTFAENSYPAFHRQIAQTTIDDLNYPEALKVFGLRLVPMVKNPILPCKGYGSLQKVHEGTFDCPVLIPKAFKFEVLGAELAAGTFVGGIGGNPYNHNPLPCPYDRGILVSNTLYKTVTGVDVSEDPERPICVYTTGVELLVNDEPVGNLPDPSFNVRELVEPVLGKAIGDAPSFFGSRSYDGNPQFSVCSLGLDGEDSSIAAYLEDGAGDTPPHTLSAATNMLAVPIDAIDLSYNSRSSYWHYVFKYNHYSLPFGDQSTETSTLVRENTDENETHWWSHRECPDNIDYLNHAFGNNITACPIDYLDVPYYASIGKFGYLGTRFQNTWKYVENDDAESSWTEVFAGASLNSDQDLYTVPGGRGGTFKVVIEMAYDFAYTAQGKPQPGPRSDVFLLADGDVLSLYHRGAESSVGISLLDYWSLEAGGKSVVDFRRPRFHDTDGFLISGLLPLVVSIKIYRFLQQQHIDYPVVDPDPPVADGGVPTYALFTDVEADPVKVEYYSRGQSSSGIPTKEDYDELIKLAALERYGYGFNISDKVLFLYLNYAIIVKSPEYQALVTLEPAGFVMSFLKFVLQNSLYNPADFSFISTSNASKSGQDSVIQGFANSLVNKNNSFETIVKKYGHAKVTKLVDVADDIIEAIDKDWYDQLINSKISRIATRYFKNIGNGKPVDLFPEGIITFSFEKANSYANSALVTYGSVPRSPELNEPGSTSIFREIPSTELRYFHTNFSNQVEIDLFNSNPFIPKKSMFAETALREANIRDQKQSFYIGYLNPRGCSKELPSPNLLRFLTFTNAPLDSIWEKYVPETSPPPATNDNSPPRQLFESMDVMDPSFSCYLPLFLQQPIDTTTKSFLPATFRVCAVDYHSIPEDKIEENRRSTSNMGRPEINYWLKKIKATDRNGENLYPLKYKWYRIAVSNIDEYLRNKKETLLEYSDREAVLNGLSKYDWCCFEGDNTPECTVVTPSLCLSLDGTLASMEPPNSVDNLSQFAGPNENSGKHYRYFCRVEGRMGWRDSEMAQIVCDKTITMEFAYINSAAEGGSADTPIGRVSFENNGLIPDKSVIFEDVEERLWNAGNDCTSWKFIGPEGLAGVTRVWTPGHLTDTRGKKVRKSHWTNFGCLGRVTTDSEEACFNLFAKRALPYCDISRKIYYPGVSILSKEVVHRTAADMPVLTLNSRVGLIADKVKNIGDLYVPSSFVGKQVSSTYSSIYPGYGTPYHQPAHFQFENNLGLIKSFSRDGDSGAITVGGSHLPTALEIVKKNIFHSPGGGRVISGPECGYVPPSFGRFVHFYVETFSTFYSLCEYGGIKPKKVKNLSHIAGGLRADHAGLQFNWLGRPKNARLKRQSMPGPYGFQWKVERHNRDRSGNGMSLGFWSYFWEKPIEEMYDAAAVVGAFKRLNISGAKNKAVSDIKTKRGNAYFSLLALSNPNQGPISTADAGKGALSAFRHVRFGPDLGPKLGCGSYRIKDATFDYVNLVNGMPVELSPYKPTKEVHTYSQVTSPAQLDLDVFGCDSVESLDCFFPCVSLKWPEGFSPKGKKMKSASIVACVDCDESPLKAGTNPEKQIFRKKISACGDGYRDACNYITPTIHMGVDSWPAGLNPAAQKLLTALHQT